MEMKVEAEKAIAGNDTNTTNVMQEKKEKTIDIFSEEKHKNNNENNDNENIRKDFIKEKNINDFLKALNIKGKKNDIANRPILAPDKQGKYSCFNVSIIDCFDETDLEMANISHGEMVQKFITENLHGVKITRKEVLLSSYRDLPNIINQLENILNDMKQGKKYDAINMSLASNMLINIQDLKVQTDKGEVQITNANINQYRDKLKEIYKKTYIKDSTEKFKKANPFYFLGGKNIVKDVTDEAFKYQDKICELMKKISDSGVKIFLANNNYCFGSLSPFDLIDLDSDYENCNNPNIITVSSSDRLWGMTPLSDVKEKSIYELNYLDGGIDITEDGIIDIIDKDNIIKNVFKREKIVGNSFGTPVVLAKYLKEQYEKNHPEEKANEQKK